MSAPYISVVVPTMRVGGLDVLFEGLAGQTFRDFELVLVDAVERRIGRYDAPVPAFLHVAPRPGPYPFPIAQFCRMANTGLAHARGEVIVFAVDYTWLPPRALERHARFHEGDADGHRGLMLPHDYRDLPPVKQGFRLLDYKSGEYGDRVMDNLEADRYAADLAAGNLDAYLWSIFNAPPPGGFGKAAVPTSAWKGADPKLAGVAGPILPDFFHAKSESLLRRHLLAVNGWNEELDGSHCYQDTDLAMRLQEHCGIEWELDPNPETVALIVNPRLVFPFAKRLRDYQTNAVRVQLARRKGFPDTNDWKLAGGA